MSKTKKSNTEPTGPSGNLADELAGTDKRQKTCGSRFWTYGLAPEPPTTSTDDLGRKWGRDDDLNVNEGRRTRQHRGSWSRRLEDLHRHFNCPPADTPLKQRRWDVPSDYPTDRHSDGEEELEELSRQLTELSELSSLPSEGSRLSGELAALHGSLSGELTNRTNSSWSGELAEGNQHSSGKLIPWKMNNDPTYKLSNGSQNDEEGSYASERDFFMEGVSRIL
jgi:hypothetical protein